MSTVNTSSPEYRYLQNGHAVHTLVSSSLTTNFLKAKKFASAKNVNVKDDNVSTIM